MLNQHFYHKTVRKAVSVFGTIFNNIHIKNEDSDGSSIKTSRVPISYAPKDKMLERINSDKERDFDTNQRVAIQLPRLSFEMTSISYNMETATSMMRKHVHRTESSDSPFSRAALPSYAPAPYKLGFQLNVYGRTQNEVLQIVEQILPYFRPDFLVTVKHSAASESVWDMPITLTGVSPSDSYEGDFESRRAIVYTLDFEVLVRFFGPISGQGVIHKATVNLVDSTSLIGLERITVSSDGSTDENGEFVINTVFDDNMFEYFG